MLLALPNRKGLIRVSLFEILVFSLLSACLDEVPEPVEVSSPVGVVMRLNKNVEGLRNLAHACMSVDSVAIFSIGYNNDGSFLYLLNMREGENIEMYSEIHSDEFHVPELSMEWVDGEFCWTIDGVFLTDSKDARICVTDLSKPVTFLLQGESICCKVNETLIDEYPVIKADHLANVTFDYDIENSAFRFQLSSGFSSILPAISTFQLLDEKVPNRSYYKDVFLDAGIGLTSRKTLAAAGYLGLSLEGISFPQTSKDTKEIAMQKAIVAGDSKDWNGRLLYPDGQPRYRLLFVNGGVSTDHGKSLGVKEW